MKVVPQGINKAITLWLGIVGFIVPIVIHGFAGPDASLFRIFLVWPAIIVTEGVDSDSHAAVVVGAIVLAVVGNSLIYIGVGKLLMRMWDRVASVRAGN